MSITEIIIKPILTIMENSRKIKLIVNLSNFYDKKVVWSLSISVGLMVGCMSDERRLKVQMP